MMILLIVCSTIVLSIENPLDDPNSLKTEILEIFNLFFTISFIIEALIKILALGFVMNGKMSYLKDYWNVLDFVIVLCSIVDLVLDT